MKKPLFILTVFALIFSSCSKVKNDSSSSVNHDVSTSKQKIDAPLPNVKKEPYKFTINASEKHQLTTATGSKITIPENAFVDLEGNTIIGDVQLTFEEFHDASDIILSGIPMNITTENGEMESLESAGMFSISGSQKGKEVRIGSNKTIEIELTSFKEEKDFNFYEFDTEKGNWIEIAQSVNTEENIARSEAEQSLTVVPQNPIEIKKASSNDQVFELAIDKNVNPEFENFDNIMWKLVNQNDNNDELFTSRVRNPGLECIDQAKSIFRLTGSVNSKKISTKVQPVMFGSNYKKAKSTFNSKLQKFKLAVEQRKIEEKKIDQMGTVYRTMSVSKFGTYNFDRLYKLRKKVQFNALFFVPALKKIFKKGYLIQGKEKVSIPYSRNGYYKFTFNPDERNTVITFDDEGNIYEFKPDDFRILENIKLGKNDEFTFNMKETGIKIHNETDFKSYLASL